MNLPSLALLYGTTFSAQSAVRVCLGSQPHPTTALWVPPSSHHYLKTFLFPKSWNTEHFFSTGCTERGTLQTLRQYKQYAECLHGKPLQSSSIGVDIFFSLIRSYFCLLVAAFRPCHTKPPRRKYIKTYPNDSMSSRRLCSESHN